MLGTRRQWLTRILIVLAAGGLLTVLAPYETGDEVPPELELETRCLERRMDPVDAWLAGSWLEDPDFHDGWGPIRARRDPVEHVS